MLLKPSAARQAARSVGSPANANAVCAHPRRKAQQRFRERQRARLAESEERLRHLSGALAQLQARFIAPRVLQSVPGEAVL